MNSFNLPSSRNAVAANEYREKIKNVSLTHLRIQQFLHLDDRHIPLPIIRLYYRELEEKPEKRNKVALMTYMMLLRDWHVTRNQLNFIRDVSKVAVMFGKKFCEQLVVLEMAVGASPVTPEDVYVQIMSKAYEEAENRGITFSEYLLQKYSDIQSLDQTTEYANTLQALFPNSTIRKRTFWNSFTMQYMMRVLKETMKTVVKLDSNNSGGFFRDSIPSWAEGPSSNALRSAREVAEDAELRRKLMEKLLETPAPKINDDVSSLSTPRVPSALTAAPTKDTEETKNQEPEEEDDTITIDTTAFRDCYRKLNAIVEEDPVVPMKQPRLEPRTHPTDGIISPPAPILDEQKILKLEHNSTEIEKALSELVNGNTIIDRRETNSGETTFDDDDVVRGDNGDAVEIDVLLDDEPDNYDDDDDDDDDDDVDDEDMNDEDDHDGEDEE